MFLENLLDARKKMRYLVNNTDEEPYQRLRKTKTKLIIPIPPSTPITPTPIISNHQPPLSFQSQMSTSLPTTPIQNSINQNQQQNDCKPTLSYIPVSSPLSSTPTIPIPIISNHQPPLSFQSLLSKPLPTAQIQHYINQNQPQNDYSSAPALASMPIPMSNQYHSFPQNVYEPPFNLSLEDYMKTFLNEQKEMMKQIEGTKILLFDISKYVYDRLSIIVHVNLSSL